MDSSCRICRRKELKDSFPLSYQSGFHKDTVLSMMQRLTGLEGAVGDQLPQQICRICMGTLVAGYELRQVCLESYSYFQKTLLKPAGQELIKEETVPSDEIDDAGLESCLTLEQVKLEPFMDVEEASNNLAENDIMLFDENGIREEKVYCCFPNCSVSYQFTELLIEHAESDHRMERESNAAKSRESDFRCIVCASAFRDEFKLMQHRHRKKTNMFLCEHCDYQTEFKGLFMEHNRAHNKKEKVCECGFTTPRTFTFRRHQAKCVPSKRRPLRQSKWKALQEHIAIDKTNDEILAMGFETTSRTSKMFYCCISHCASVCATQQQLCDHFQAAHPEVWEENTKGAGSSDSGGDMIRCPVCSLRMDTKKALQIHLEDAYAPTFRCITCSYNCISRKSAILHAANQVCSIESWLSCKHCGVKVSNKIALGQHVSRVHLTSEATAKRYECEDCLQRFGSSFALRRHRKNIHKVDEDKPTRKYVKKEK